MIQGQINKTTWHVQYNVQYRKIKGETRRECTMQLSNITERQVKWDKGTHNIIQREELNKTI